MRRGWVVASSLLLAVTGCGRSSVFADSWGHEGSDAGHEENEDDVGASITGPDDDGDDDDEPVADGCGDGVIVPGELCFLPQVTFVSRIDPCSIDIGDLDSDGHLDVAVPNSDFSHAESDDNFATVLYGDGTGRLSAPYPSLAGSDFAVGLAVGSFDADGLDDLAVANNEAATLNVMLSLGERTFASPSAMRVGEVPTVVASADLDGDGFDDVGVTLGEGAVAIALSRGDGSFHDPVLYRRGGSPWGLAFGDLNGDHVPDMVAADISASRLFLWFGTGDGTFVDGGSVEVGLGPSGVSAADIDGDGRLDLLVANGDSATVSVLLGDGAGGFTRHHQIATDAGTRAVAISDFDMDGHADLAVVCADSGTLQFFVGDGTGEFEPRDRHQLGNLPVDVRAGDFNEDGIDDLAVANQLSDNVGLILSNP